MLPSKEEKINEEAPIVLEGCVPFPETFVKRYKEKGYWIDKTLGEEFDEFVSKHSDRVALAYEGKYVSYREMGEKVNRLALHFIQRIGSSKTGTP